MTMTLKAVGGPVDGKEFVFDTETTMVFWSVSSEPYLADAGYWYHKPECHVYHIGRNIDGDNEICWRWLGKVAQ